MTTPSPHPPAGHEARWPIAGSILAFLLLLVILPDHLSLLPDWTHLLIAAVACLPVLGVALGQASPRWLRMERSVILALGLLLVVWTIAALNILVRQILGEGGPLDPLELLASSVIVWVGNILAFSLLFWQIDGDGPVARGRGDFRPDWLFPSAALPHWVPSYADYFFLSFSTATAFSATDAAPLTVRAKMLMMLQSVISLATLAIVASRAINVLS